MQSADLEIDLTNASLPGELPHEMYTYPYDENEEKFYEIPVKYKTSKSNECYRDKHFLCIYYVPQENMCLVIYIYVCIWIDKITCVLLLL